MLEVASFVAALRMSMPTDSPVLPTCSSLYLAQCRHQLAKVKSDCARHSKAYSISASAAT